MEMLNMGLDAKDFFFPISNHDIKMILFVLLL